MNRQERIRVAGTLADAIRAADARLPWPLRESLAADYAGLQGQAQRLANDLCNEATAHNQRLGIVYTVQSGARELARLRRQLRELQAKAAPAASPATKLAELAAAHRRTLAGRALRDLPPADAFRCRMLRGRAEKLCRAYASKPEREAAWQKWQADASAGPAAGKGSGGIVAGVALLAVGLFAAATARAASQPTPETLPPSL